MIVGSICNLLPAVAMDSKKEYDRLYECPQKPKVTTHERMKSMRPKSILIERQKLPDQARRTKKQRLRKASTEQVWNTETDAQKSID